MYEYFKPCRNKKSTNKNANRYRHTYIHTDGLTHRQKQGSQTVAEAQ